QPGRTCASSRVESSAIPSTLAAEMPWPANPAEAHAAARCLLCETQFLPPISNIRPSPRRSPLADILREVHSPALPWYRQDRPPTRLAPSPPPALLPNGISLSCIVFSFLFPPCDTSPASSPDAHRSVHKLCSSIHIRLHTTHR